MLHPLLLVLAIAAGTWGCRSDQDKGPTIVGPGGDNFCDLPGSVRFTESGIERVADGDGADRLTFMKLPNGFCAHYFGNVGNARNLAFSPSGDLFVASPTTVTTGGGARGGSEIVFLTDDDDDGVVDFAKKPNGEIEKDANGNKREIKTTFLDKIPSAQGMLFAEGYFYYQDDTRILRMPFEPNQRELKTRGEVFADIQVYKSPLHWPKPIDIADDGTIYVGNGGDQGEECDTTRPFRGGILRLDGAPGGTPISRGFRNPIAIRCPRGKNLCFAAELAMDYSAGEGGREKLVPIHEGDDYGFPCCQTQDIPAVGVNPEPDCTDTTPEEVSFLIGDTPFPFDFEPGKWPKPYTGAVFIPLHGAAGTWAGARVVSVDVDPETGMPLPGTNIPGKPPGAMRDFATGWDDKSRAHGRPAAITFAADGRLFLANDNDGNIFWIAPLDLKRPQ